jgi:hypothetical protein
MAGKIIADIIEAPFDSIKMNVANVTVLTANNSGLTYLPTGNVNINIGSTASLTLGNVTVSNLITANGGIKFPATQVASADANTLDDYEEGTWTPTIVASSSNPSVTYSIQAGYYTKIGRQVFIQGIVELTARTGGSGQARISGLPFTISNATQGATVGLVGQMKNFTSSFGDTDGQMIVVRPNGNSTVCNFFESNETQGDDWPIGNIGATFLTRFSVTYFVD